MNKKGIEFSFGWLFALVVGAAIIFLAIYAAIKFIGSEQTVQETEAAKQLGTILTPIETGSEQAKATLINFSSETRVYNNCSTAGNFGEQSIRVSTMFGNKWQEQGLPITSYNKYIFSLDMMQSTGLYVFSKPFEMPFKTANLLFIWSNKYCFVNTPLGIENEITELGLNNINLTGDLTKCEKGSRKVCFELELESCDLIVNEGAKSVTDTRKGKTVYYEGSLIYGAIFSEPEVYECQVKRLMKRTSELAILYNDKSALISAESNGCSSNLQGDLQALASASGQLNNSAELREINFLAESLGEKEGEIVDCKLWGE